MRNVTLSADEALIDTARKRAASEHTTLNNLFREWLARYAGEPRLTAEQIRQTVTAVAHFRAGRPFTREERK
jgi:hypothetical protein